MPEAAGEARERYEDLNLTPPAEGKTSWHSSGSRTFSLSASSISSQRSSPVPITHTLLEC
jgi:hypothetical protein